VKRWGGLVPNSRRDVTHNLCFFWKSEYLYMCSNSHSIMNKLSLFTLSALLGIGYTDARKISDVFDSSKSLIYEESNLEKKVFDLDGRAEVTLSEDQSMSINYVHSHLKKITGDLGALIPQLPLPLYLVDYADEKTDFSEINNVITKIHVVDSIYDSFTNTHHTGLMLRDFTRMNENGESTLLLQQKPAFVENSSQPGILVDRVVSEYLHSVAGTQLLKLCGEDIVNSSGNPSDVNSIIADQMLNEEAFIEASALAYVHANFGDSVSQTIIGRYEQLGGPYEQAVEIMQSLDPLTKRTYIAPFVHYITGGNIPVEKIVTSLDASGK
jgi:hypothetical protein